MLNRYLGIAGQMYVRSGFPWSESLTRTHRILLDITSTLPCECTLASVPPLADVRSGSRTKQLSS